MFFVLFCFVLLCFVSFCFLFAFYLQTIARKGFPIKWGRTRGNISVHACRIIIFPVITLFFFKLSAFSRYVTISQPRSEDHMTPIKWMWCGEFVDDNHLGLLKLFWDMRHAFTRTCTGKFPSKWVIRNTPDLYQTLKVKVPSVYMVGNACSSYNVAWMGFPIEWKRARGNISVHACRIIIFP